MGLEITYDGAAGSDIVVLTPTAGGPASKAGVKAGDVIVSVDGTPTRGLSLYDVSDLLQGEADSQVGSSTLLACADCLHALLPAVLSARERRAETLGVVR